MTQEKYNKRAAAECFAAHQALVQTERANPALRSNPHWVMLRQDAYERFSLAYEVQK